MTELHRLVFPLMISLFLFGCGSDYRMPTAEVSGMVFYKGKPVREGELRFAPESTGTEPAGKPGAAVVHEDGTFTVCTYGEGDGAVLGTHTLTYVAPPPRPKEQKAVTSSGDTGDAGPAIPSSYEGLVPEEAKVIIKSGNNNIRVVLIKP